MALVISWLLWSGLKVHLQRRKQAKPRRRCNSHPGDRGNLWGHLLGEKASCSASSFGSTCLEYQAGKGQKSHLGRILDHYRPHLHGKNSRNLSFQHKNPVVFIVAAVDLFETSWGQSEKDQRWLKRSCRSSCHSPILAIPCDLFTLWQSIFFSCPKKCSTKSSSESWSIFFKAKSKKTAEAPAPVKVKKSAPEKAAVKPPAPVGSFEVELDAKT